MKKIVFISIFTLFLFLPQQLVAQEEINLEEVITKSSEAAVFTQEALPASVLVDEYELPYPGLLADNPLYGIKTLRDKIIGFLIASPIKKAEFDILQVDKRLNVAVYLLKKKDKESLAESTISKGQNYYDDAITKIKEAKQQGLETKEISKKLLLSTQKHEEVLESLEKRVSGKTKKKFTKLLQRASEYQKQASAFVSKEKTRNVDKAK